MRMDQSLHIANCGTIVHKVWNLAHNGKSEKHQERAPAQGQARLNPNQKKIASDILVIQLFFMAKEQQYHKKCLFFSGLFNTAWLFI